MKNHDALNSSTYWDARYLEKRNGWDLGGAHPFMPKVLSYVGSNKNLRTLVIGAGPGHDAEYLSGAFTKVCAVDFSLEAQKSFFKYYPTSSVEYILADVLSPKTQLETFDLVFEHTLLCAIDPSRHTDYFDFITRHLASGGQYAGIIWNRTPVGADGPPFSTPQDRVQKFLKECGFKIHVEAPVEPTIPGRETSETFILARKI